MTKTRIKKVAPETRKGQWKKSRLRISRSEVETQIRKLITEKFEERKRRKEETKRKVVNHKGRLR